jgi:Cu(I)/Ag(I) efflux system membrane fusion protein
LVLVPAEAVIRTGKRNVVIVAGADGKFTPVEVEIGRESGDMSEIRKGLAAGQRVVVSGQFLVDSEASLRGALARLESKQSGTPITQPAPATTALHKAEGVVRAVGDEVTIKHGAIPSAGMGAMTMAFKPPKDGLPPDIKPGMNVRFQFTLTPQGEMQLRSIVVADATAQDGMKK